MFDSWILHWMLTIIDPSRRSSSSNATFHCWFSEPCSHLSRTNMRQKLPPWLARHFEIELKLSSFLSFRHSFRWWWNRMPMNNEVEGKFTKVRPSVSELPQRYIDLDDSSLLTLLIWKTSVESFLDYLLISMRWVRQIEWITRDVHWIIDSSSSLDTSNFVFLLPSLQSTWSTTLRRRM